MALWKSQKIWPSVTQLDVFIFLGIGTNNYLSSKMPKFCYIYHNGFIPKLFQLFFFLLNSQKTWQDFINSLDVKSHKDYFWLNIVFASQKPTLDDVSSMDLLWKNLYFHPIFYNHNNTVFALLATSFFFELLEIPFFGSGRLHCQSTIRCCLTRKIILSVLERVYKSPLHFYIDNKWLGQVKSNIYYHCQRYFQQVYFYIWYLTNIITLYLQSNRNRRKISSFLQSVKWIVQQQRLESVFDMANYRSPGRSFCIVYSLQTKKRPRSSDNFGLASKRLYTGLYYECQTG